MMDVEKEVKFIIADFADSTEFEDGDSLEDLGIDNTCKVEFLAALEREFEISIDDEAADSLTSVRDVVDCVVNLQESQ